MKHVCVVYNVPLQRLLKAERQSNEDICEALHSGISYRLYKTRRIVKLSNLDHHSLSLQDMSPFV